MVASPSDSISEKRRRQRYRPEPCDARAASAELDAILQWRDRHSTAFAQTTTDKSAVGIIFVLRVVNIAFPRVENNALQSPLLRDLAEIISQFRKYGRAPVIGDGAGFAVAGRQPPFRKPAWLSSAAA